MKRKLVIMVVMVLGIIATADAQFRIRVRKTPKVIRPARPFSSTRGARRFNWNQSRRYNVSHVVVGGLNITSRSYREQQQKEKERRYKTKHSSGRITYVQKYAKNKGLQKHRHRSSRKRR